MLNSPPRRCAATKWPLKASQNQNLASGETLAEINLADFLADNPEVDCTRQEVLIPIYIEFKSGEVLVRLPEWYVQEVKPEF